MSAEKDLVQKKRENSEKIHFFETQMKLVKNQVIFLRHLQKEYYVGLLQKSNEHFTKETVRIIMRLEELNVDNWELSCPSSMSAGYRDFLKKMVRASQERQQL